MSSPRDPTQFTRESAERIGRVVRAAELSPRPASPLGFDRIDVARNAKVFRVCTFTGAWSIGSSKTVTFKNQTATPNTVSATNLFFPVTSTASATKDCAIAKDGTAWYLIDVPMATATAVFVTSTATRTFVSGTAMATVISQTATATVIAGTATAVSVSGATTQNVITDIAVSGLLNTSDCTITIGKTLTTASMTFVTGTATALSVTGTATAMIVSQTAAAIVVSQTATSVFVTGTVTATYISFG